MNEANTAPQPHPWPLINKKGRLRKLRRRLVHYPSLRFGGYPRANH